MKKLTFVQRERIAEMYFDGMPIKDIMTKVGCTLDDVYEVFKCENHVE